MLRLQGLLNSIRCGLCVAFSMVLASCASTTIGPQAGGRISGIAASPYDEDVLLVSSPGCGLWQSVDNDEHWKNISSTIDDPNSFHIEWDAIDPDRLFVVSAGLATQRAQVVSLEWTGQATRRSSLLTAWASGRCAAWWVSNAARLTV